jgi:hypothetical protein
MIRDFRIHFQLMTVPGQVFYGASRKSVLKGADGIVFVADSQIPLLDANLENFDGLRTNLMDFNVDLNFIPLVFQYNKRDLENLIPVETFNSLLNPLKLPYVEAAAINGVGVFETLKEIAKLTVPYVKEKVFGEKPEPPPERPGGRPAVAKPSPPAEPQPGAREESGAAIERGAPPDRDASAAGDESRPQAESTDRPEEPAPTAETVPEKEDLDFVSERPDTPIRMTKIKLKSHIDVEKEMEKLAREFSK